MKLLNPPLRLSKYGGGMNPKIGQATRNHQSRQALGDCQMALLYPKPTAFMVVKQALNPKTHAIAFDRIVGIRQGRDQVDRLLLFGVPDPNQQYRTILLGSHAYIRQTHGLAARERQ